MRKSLYFLFGALTLLCETHASATIFGHLRGIVHDPQHRPIEGAQVGLQSQTSDWTRTTKTNGDGEFELNAVPLGEYTVSISHPGFTELVESIVVESGSSPILHFAMKLAELTQRVEVSGAPQTVNAESSTTQSLVDRMEIQRTPGAENTNSLAMITDFVPGAVIAHDQLHIRGGHQVGWLVDGVPVPNTNIASNVGPQFDPKDVDYLEVQRGGYSAEYGDRTFGVFNVVTRSGFERNDEGELVVSYGSQNTTNDQISFGSHTERFAYYASLNANRSDLGLLKPAPGVLHDLESGEGGFASLIFNASSNDQLRLVASLRGDHYQIPNTPEQHRAGIRDLERESDSFANFSWVHTLSPGMLLTFSPFYHFNRSSFDGGPKDTPVVAKDDRASNYVGAQASFAVVAGKHSARLGIYTFGQHDDSFFGLLASDGNGLALRQRLKLWGNLAAAFLEEHYKPTTWLTLNGGVRLTHFAGALSENATSPRLGAALRLPHWNWVLRGSYGRYYQAPPLDTVSGPLLNLALQQGFGFLPLHGERDQQYEVGLAIPFFGWALDADYFHTTARNFLDHDELANSNIFLPLTIPRARIRGWETTLHSPRLFGRARLHMAYSHQFAEGAGGVNGGLTDFSPPSRGFFFLDHDQRDTLSSGFEVDLPWGSWISGNISFGSGFLDGNGPSHLPAHTTVDLSVGKLFSDGWSLQADVLNAGNRRYLIDNSNTFGGTHFANPRQISVQLRYRFHY